jgi:hypothetical protein
MTVNDSIKYRFLMWLLNLVGVLWIIVFVLFGIAMVVNGIRSDNDRCVRKGGHFTHVLGFCADKDGKRL